MKSDEIQSEKVGENVVTAEVWVGRYSLFCTLYCEAHLMQAQNKSMEYELKKSSVTKFTTT